MPLVSMEVFKVIVSSETSLAVYHELRHAQVRGDTHQHVDVIRTCVRFQNLHFLLLAQRPEDFPDAHFDLTVHSLSTKFRRKYDMVLAIPSGV